MMTAFEADWNRQPFKPTPQSKLIWCPDNGRERIAHFIDEATHTLFLQNERYQDTVIIERLVRAARRGVKIHVMARPLDLTDCAITPFAPFVQKIGPDPIYLDPIYP